MYEGGLLGAGKKKKERMEDAGSDAGVSVYVCRMPVLEMSEKECT